MAVLSRETHGPLSRVVQDLPADAKRLLDDIIDQSNRVQAIADSEKEHLQGIIDFYRTRSDTKTTVAAERLAVIAAVTALLSPVYGMNLIVNEHTRLS